MQLPKGFPVVCVDNISGGEAMTDVNTLLIMAQSRIEKLERLLNCQEEIRRDVFRRLANKLKQKLASVQEENDRLRDQITRLSESRGTP
jgi:hypothetical protein